MKRREKHGLSATPGFFAWSMMLQRCSNPNTDSYSRYGGRGISVCERWRDYGKFYEDMGERPAGMSIGRINNDGNYEPSNCRWETQRQQSRNMCRNRYITALGQTKLLCEWVEATGLKPSSILSRIARWGSEEMALSRPKYDRSHLKTGLRAHNIETD